MGNYCKTLALSTPTISTTTSSVLMPSADRFRIACCNNQEFDALRLALLGVDINSVNWYGHTGLMLAMGHGSTQVVKILFDYCTNIELPITNDAGRTALDYACQRNKVEFVERFLSHHTCTMSMVMMRDVNGDTAEMIALRKGNHECVRL